MNPIDKNPVKGAETQDSSHNQDSDLEKIRYYKGTWKNFFDYWNKRGVETDPYKGTVLKYPEEKIDNGNAPHQDFGTYDKKKANKLTESFDEFINESYQSVNRDTKKIFPVKNDKQAENLLSKLVSTQRTERDITAKDVYGEEQTIPKGTVLQVYYIVNSADSSFSDYRRMFVQKERTKNYYFPTDYCGVEQSQLEDDTTLLR